MSNTKTVRHTKTNKSKSFKTPSNLLSKKLFIFVLIFAGIGSYFIYHSFAASPRTGGMLWNHQETSLSPLDGQGSPTSPVYNTTCCAWNDQDNFVNSWSGSLTGSTSNTMCLVADYDDSAHGQYPKDILFKVYAASDSLDVSLTNDAGNTWQSPPSTASGSQRLWQLCVSDPVADAANVSEANLSYWPIIPGTNGGRGKIVNYTLRITSAKGTTRKVNVQFEIAQSGDAAPGRTLSTPCPANDGL